MVLTGAIQPSGVPLRTCRAGGSRLQTLPLFPSPSLLLRRVSFLFFFFFFSFSPQKDGEQVSDYLGFIRNRCRGLRPAFRFGMILVALHEKSYRS